MESVDFLDRHLDPPDLPEPECQECDGCGLETLKESLHKEGLYFLCDDCIKTDADQTEKE